MAHFSYLSYHAQKRAAQRTALRGDEIASILNAGLAVDAGCMPGFNKRHWLFYSAPDDACYVAVQDTLTGTVLTILPLAYQERLAWKIDDADCERCR